MKKANVRQVRVKESGQGEGERSNYAIVMCHTLCPIKGHRTRNST